MKFLTEIIKFSETFCANIIKLLKNPSILPKHSVCNSQAMIQTFDFFKSLFELEIKKTEEWTKIISGNSVILLDVIIKELYTDENNLVNFWGKFLKETNVYKEKSSKNFAQKEKTLSNILVVKEDIQKTSDDPNNFNKFESKLTNLRMEESNINDNIIDNNRKLKKYVEENIDPLKTLIKTYKVNETLRFNELKDSIINIVTVIERMSNVIGDFLMCHTQVFVKQSPKEETRNILMKFIKDFHIDESAFDFFFNIHTKEEVKLIEENVNESVDKSEESKKLLENLCFLNKEEMTVFKDFNAEFINQVKK